jgi:predicted amidohydrolase
MGQKVKVAAAVPPVTRKPYTISEAELFDRVETDLEAYRAAIRRAKDEACIAVGFTELILGLGEWTAARNYECLDVLGRAEEMTSSVMRDAARKNEIYVAYCLNAVEGDTVANTGFFMGRDGDEIGRYQKVHLPPQELYKVGGSGFPVFETEELGCVGLSICYDMVFPETARCLALNGADVVFQMTQGGAAFGSQAVSDAAYQTRAVDNALYLVIIWDYRSRIIAPTGEVIASMAKGEQMVSAAFDPFSGRRGGCSLGGTYDDIRARIFRERRTDVYDEFTDASPPILAKLSDKQIPSKEESVRIAALARSTCAYEFEKAKRFFNDGKIDEAVAIFEELVRKVPRTHLDLLSRGYLERIRRVGDSETNG